MVEEAGNNNFFETEFAKINSRDCTLLIEFVKEGFSYSIIQNSKNTVLYTAVSDAFIDFFNATETHLSEIISTEKLFNYSFAKVIILVDNLYSTLVPNDFFDLTKIKETLTFNHNLPANDLVFLSDDISSIEYQNLFVSTKTLESAIKKNFVSAEIHSTESILLDFLNKKNVSNSYFHLHLGLKKMHCCYFEDKALKFNNSFLYNTSEDVLFNLLNVYKHLGLNNEKTVLNLSGAISEKTEKYDLLYKYVKYISFSKRPVKLNYSERVNQMPEQYFIHHYAALL